MQINARFLAVARDPRIIPGVHQHCDEWCDYCPVTSRCLAFRCTAEFRKQHRRRDTDPTFASMDEAVVFTRELSAIEGVPTDELDALVANPPGASGIETKDPLAEAAWDYAVRAAILLMPMSAELIAAPPDPSGPQPEQVVFWYHLRIYMRVFRALVAKERAASNGRMEDAIGSAKLALVSVARSRDALRRMDQRFDAGEQAGLIAMLDELERGIDEQFPEARAFVRLGLDVPVV